MPRPKKIATKVPKVEEAKTEESKDIKDVLPAKKASIKRNTLILNRDDIDKVEKYVKEGKKVHVKGVGAKRKYIVYLRGD